MRLLFLPVLVIACDEASLPAGPNGATDADTPDADSDSSDASIQLTWWQDVEPIVRARCQLCHGDPPQFGAPRSFVDYEDTQVLIGTTPAHEVMVYRIFADQRRMPPNTQPPLTAEEQRIIRAWSENGAPEGTRPDADAGEPPDDAASADAGVADPDAGAPIDGGPPIADAGEPAPDAGMTSRPISRVIELRATEPSSTDPYVLPVQDTNYVCWAVTIPAGASASEFAFRFEPMIDNTINLHHMLLLHDPDAGNPPGPFACSGLPLDWTMIAEWAPGRGADELPLAAGVPIQAGEQVVLQVHYDNVTAPGITDNSGIRMALTDMPGLIPAGILWSGVVWATPINGNDVSLTSTCTLDQPITMFSVFPHMHLTGVRIMLEVQRGGSGAWTPIVDITGWSFEDQPHVRVPPAEQLVMPGDQLRTTCWWDTQGMDEYFGESSGDEMCFNFIYHYPRVPFDRVCVGGAP